MPEQTRAFASQSRPASSQCDREVGAWEPGGDAVNGSKLSWSDMGHVVVERDARPMPSEDGLRARVFLDLPHHLGARALEPEVEPADAGE